MNGPMYREMMYRMVPIAAGGMMLLLASCQAATDDPRKGGFLTGISNLATGGYEARIQREEEGLRLERDSQARLQQQTAKLVREREQLARELAIAESRTTDIERTIRRHKTRLAASRPAHSHELLQLASLEGQVRATQTWIEQAKDPSRAMDEARGDIVQIMGTLDDLGTAVAQLANQ
jgi:septal ring factor EnvC (AmiA/AmiB activator)